MIYLLGATVVLLIALEVAAILFMWASVKRLDQLKRGWDAVNRDLDDAEEKRRKGLQ